MTDFSRQADLANPKDFDWFHITIVGAGGIGAATTLCLAKVGFNKIEVYDHDKVSDVNYPNQLLPVFYFVTMQGGVQHYKLNSTIGLSKVEVLSDLIFNMTGVNITIKDEKYIDQPLGDIVVCAVDNMKTRKAIWNRVKDDTDVLLYIDGRMAGNDHTIYSVDMIKDIDEFRCYESTLYSDEEASEVPCTAKSTIYTNMNIASLITDICIRWVRQEQFPGMICSNMRAFTMNTSIYIPVMERTK